MRQPISERWASDEEEGGAWKVIHSVMLSCRIRGDLRRQLKLASIARDEPMARIVERAIQRELKTMENEEQP